jgi:hypothetical protein
MANVKTFNLSVYLPGSNSKTITFRGISRTAVSRYQAYYIREYSNPYFNVEAR